MKSKAKTTLIALFAIISGIQAQDFGFKAGPSMNRITNIAENSSSQGPGYESSSKDQFILGYSIGGTVEFKLNDNLSLTTGLTFRQAGTKLEMSASYSDPSNPDNRYSTSTDFKLYTNYLELPVQMKVGFPVGEAKVYGLFGGFASFGIAGKYTYNSKYTETYMGETFTAKESNTEKLEFGFDDNKDDMQALNIGIIPGIGVEFKNFQIEASYNLGLNNPFFDSDQINRVQSINLTIGYKFNKK